MATDTYLSPIEFERHHAELAQPTLEASNPDDGSVGSISPKPGDGPTTRRVSTVAVDSVANASIPPDNHLVVPTGGPAQAATNGDQAMERSRWPLRAVVTEQAR
jgi:hypothetical protein